MPDFGKWLKRTRAAANITGEKLAELIGASQGNVSMYERGDRNPKPERVKEIAKALGADTDEALLAAGYAPEHIPELTRELDTDTAEMVHFYEGLSPSSRSISKTMIQQLREVERAASIGGGLPPETDKE